MQLKARAVSRQGVCDARGVIGGWVEVHVGVEGEDGARIIIAEEHQIIGQQDCLHPRRRRTVLLPLHFIYESPQAPGGLFRALSHTDMTPFAAIVEQAKLVASAKLGEAQQQAKLVTEQGARHVSAKLEQVSGKLKDFAEPQQPIDTPCFEEALANATTALALAQDALGDAVARAPTDCRERRDVLAATHDQLSALANVVRAVHVGATNPLAPAIIPKGVPSEGATEAAASEYLPLSPEEVHVQEKAEPVVDLLEDLRSSDGLPADHAPLPSANSLPMVHPSLEELLGDLSATTQLEVEAPLIPESARGSDGAGGEPGAQSAQPAKRIKLPEPLDPYAPHEPEETYSAIERRVAVWREGKNIQAMLATLHEIAPGRCRWQPRSLGELLDEDALRYAYKLAKAAMHNDKLPAGMKEWERARAQMIFHALLENKP